MAEFPQSRRGRRAELSQATGIDQGTRGHWVRRGLVVTGLLLILAGVAVIAVPLYFVWQRGKADDQALAEWNAGGSQAIVGGLGAPIGSAGEGAAEAPLTCHASSAPPDDYALVRFPSLAQYSYAGVAGDGTWDLLRHRSMVHYKDSASPGDLGNVIIGFHREPHYEHIDLLKKGDVVDIQDRSCHTFHYRVTSMAVKYPNEVNELTQTSGHDLTLITCTPWWRDYQRIVWRATLITAAA